MRQYAVVYIVRKRNIFTANIIIFIVHFACAAGAGRKRQRNSRAERKHGRVARRAAAAAAA